MNIFTIPVLNVHKIKKTLKHKKHDRNKKTFLHLCIVQSTSATTTRSGLHCSTETNCYVTSDAYTFEEHTFSLSGLSLQTYALCLTVPV